jgi:hypothetical protein
MLALNKQLDGNKYAAGNHCEEASEICPLTFDGGLATIN